MKTLQLHILKGDTDWQGNEITEDRFIVLENDFDLYGEHFNLNTAIELLGLSVGSQVKIINPNAGDFKGAHTVRNYNEVTNRCLISPNQSSIYCEFLISADELQTIN